MKTILISIVLGTVLTAFCFVAGLFFSGGGHSLTAMAIFFPYASIVAVWLKDTGWQSMGLLLIAVQFPVYAILIARTGGGGRKVLLSLALLTIHVLIAIMGLANYKQLRRDFDGVLTTAPSNKALQLTARQHAFQLALFPQLEC